MKILLTGKTGQVGYELERSLQGLGEIVAVDRAQMNLSDLDQVRVVLRAVNPQLIVNAAAYTAVDQAEREPDLAIRINAEAPGVMAEEARRLGAAMVHYSTDYVFDGTKSVPYTEDDIICPINSYGRSKLLGEQAIAAAGIPHLILRTSWVYGMRGKNFLLTILRLAQERDELRIVDDQYGAPTWSRSIAGATAEILKQGKKESSLQEWLSGLSGIYNLTAAGQTTWFKYAQAAIRAKIPAMTGKLSPIQTVDFPLPANRPKNSCLDTRKLQLIFQISLPQWDVDLTDCLA